VLLANLDLVAVKAVKGFQDHLGQRVYKVQKETPAIPGHQDQQA
jgi:hypothetical protein